MVVKALLLALHNKDNSFFVKSGTLVVPDFIVPLLQIKYILFVGEITAGTDDLKMRQAIQNKIRVYCRRADFSVFYF